MVGFLSRNENKLFELTEAAVRAAVYRLFTRRPRTVLGVFIDGLLKPTNQRFLIIQRCRFNY